jgi:galactokinase
MTFDLQDYNELFKKIYGEDEDMLSSQRKRYEKLIREYRLRFNGKDFHLFSTPGRTEIGGNHTDHNNGRVLAASVNLDSIAVAGRNDNNRVVLYSVGYNEPFEVNLDCLDVVREEKETTSALIRGIAFRLSDLGHEIGGFNACITSDVSIGSGLSSSASIEVLIGTIFNKLYNNGEVGFETIAITGQYAENNYFGKPCGLMDQMACAVGGIISIDFKHPHAPVVKKIDFDFDASNYRLLVVDTGSSHEDLTDDYKAVPSEMKEVASKLGKNTCRDINMDELLLNIKELRTRVSDRALLRAFHFINENERVLAQVKELESGNFSGFLELVRDSGRSSFMWLQNVYSTKKIEEQGVTLALALTEHFLDEIDGGACRVHGGGFAGTVQVFLPDDRIERYKNLIEPVFGKESILSLKIRSQGTLHLEK